jgi:O-succinylbenzoate synthase
MTGVTVERARAYEVAIPLREPFAISTGVMRERRSLIVELREADGAVGYGESAPFEAPFYSEETLDTAAVALRTWLLPRLIGTPLTHSSELHELLERGVRGHRMARAGIETAWWDLQAAKRGVSLADLVTARIAELGAPLAARGRRPFVECGVALGIPESRSVQALVQEVEAAVLAGYRRIKLKIHPGWDLEPVRATRRTLARMGATVPVTVDANGAYTLAHEKVLRELDGEGLAFLEQPLPPGHLIDTIALARRLSTPVCLDESLISDEVARQVVEAGGPMVWNLKVQRVGGLEEACRIYVRGVAARARLWVGTMPETGVGAQAALALGAHVGFTDASDLEPSDRWYAGEDLVRLTMDGAGRMAVPATRTRPTLAGARLLHETAASV